MWKPIEELPRQEGLVLLAMVEIQEGQALPDLLRIGEDPDTEALKGAGYTYFWSEPLDPDVMERNPYIGTIEET